MIDLSGLQMKPPAAASSFVKDTDEMRFEQDVLQASLARPVIVQFTAMTSALSRQMVASLEKLVNEAAGAIAMVKVDTTANPGLAQALRVQAVPTTYIFYQGQPVNGFSGSKPEPELKQIVDSLKKLAGAPAGEEVDRTEEIKKMLGEGDAFFQKGQYEAAMERYGTALDLDHASMEALGGIGWCLLSMGDADSAREMLTQVSPEQLSAPRLKGLQYILSLGDEANNLENLIEGLVAQVKKNKEGEAKAKLLDIFEALGNAHPLTSPGRRKLSTVLFS